MLLIPQRQLFIRIVPMFGILCLLSLLTITASCKSKKQEKAPDKIATPKKEIAPVLELELGPCFGKCPAYKASFYMAGQMDFEGIAHTKVIGKYRYTIKADLVKDLVTALETIKPMTLKDDYGLAPDFPVTKITYRSGGKVKTIETAANIPDDLLKMQQTIKDAVMMIITEQPGEPIKD